MQYLLLFIVGLIAGTLNVLAGGGSFLTIPLLIFMGLRYWSAYTPDISPP